MAQRGWRRGYGQCTALSLCRFPSSGMGSPQAVVLQEIYSSMGSPWAAGNTCSSTWSTFSSSFSHLGFPSVVSHSSPPPPSSIHWFLPFLKYVFPEATRTSLVGSALTCRWSLAAGWPDSWPGEEAYLLQRPSCRSPSSPVKTLPCTPISVINHFSAVWWL